VARPLVRAAVRPIRWIISRVGQSKFTTWAISGTRSRAPDVVAISTEATTPKAVESLAALRLDIGVQALTRWPAAPTARHAIGAMFGAREDERLTALLAEEPQQERRLLQEAAL